MHRRLLRISVLDGSFPLAGEFFCCLSLESAKALVQRTASSSLNRWQEDVDFELDSQNFGTNLESDYVLISVWSSGTIDRCIGSLHQALGRARVSLKSLLVSGRPHSIRLGSRGIVIRMQARMVHVHGRSPPITSIGHHLAAVLQPSKQTANRMRSSISSRAASSSRPLVKALAAPRGRHALDFALVLPDELCIAVLQFLPVRDLAHSAAVSKRWKCLADDPWLWKELFRNGSSRVLLLPASAPLEPLLNASASLTHVAAELPLWKALCRVRKHCGSIDEAMSRARSGDRLLLAPGRYTGGVQMHKSVELIGLGASPADVVIEATEQNALICSAKAGVVRNITFRQRGESRYFCVDITDGSVLLDRCDISSEGLSAVAIRGTAAPIVRNNVIHDSKEAGVFLFDNTSAIIENNHIHSNNVGGVEIRGGRAVLRGNRITLNQYKGVMVSQGSDALLEENEISFNTGIGVEIRAGANPTLRRNRICESQRSGVLLCDEDTHGLLLENDIFANSIAGVSVCSGASPILSRNTIRDGKQSGVYFCSRGSGLLEQNDISNNALAGVEIKSGCNPILRHNKIHGSKQHDIVERGMGILETNEIFENALSGVEVLEHASPILRANVIHHNGENGVYMVETARGVYHANEFYGNAKTPFNAVREGVAPPVLLVENKILDETTRRTDSTTASSVTSPTTLNQDAAVCQTKPELPLWEREVLACRNVQGPADASDLVLM